MSRDITTWEALNLRHDGGIPLADKDEETLLEIAGKALHDGDSDPKPVLQAIKRVTVRAHLVENLRAYAIRAIFRAKRKAEAKQAITEQLVNIDRAAEVPDFSQIDQIENRILVRELLETLCPQDREIFLRGMAGETCEEIDLAMNLKPRTAERRVRICKSALRKELQEKLDRKTCARAC